MNPQTTIADQEAPEETRLQEKRLQEQFIREVEDHSLPAQQVLTEQQDGRDRDQGPALFVP